uniref:Uncharacterized protein n=1 Tax=Oryza meridionalis TaxID=40149 RepID=A0A0E0D2W5_9ORYZ
MAASGVAAGLLSSCLLRPGLGMHELTISNTELGHLFDGMQQKEAAFSQIALAPTLLGGLGSGGGSGDSYTALASGYGQTQRMAFHATSNVSMKSKQCAHVRNHGVASLLVQIASTMQLYKFQGGSGCSQNVVAREFHFNMQT